MDKTFIDEADILEASLPYVKIACGLGIISGMPDRAFKPQDTLTREQAESNLQPH